MQNSTLGSKKLDDIDNEFERGVFQAAYRSSTQKRRRVLAIFILGLVHTLRGLLFSWPLYLLPLSVLALPEQYKFLFIVFLIPGVYISVLILKKGIKEDYQSLIAGRLLTNKIFKQLFSLKTAA